MPFLLKRFDEGPIQSVRFSVPALHLQRDGPKTFGGVGFISTFIDIESLCLLDSVTTVVAAHRIFRSCEAREERWMNGNGIFP